MRYEPGQRLTVMGGWSEPGSQSVPPASVLPLDGPTATHEVLRTGRPARIDSFEGVPGELAQMLRETGLRTAIAAPISVGGRLWGAVTVSKTNDERFAPGAEARLGNFTALVAQAIANAEARDELAASRARIVEAADEARRRLERNLHDGAQQRLVSLSISLRLAQSKLSADPAGAGEILGGASAELAQALEELRELARGIHPAILTDRGLRPALEALAARVPLPVEIEHDLEARLPSTVEAAAYYVVSESLANVAKYAQASQVLVRVSRDDGCACIEVVDDGVGGADPLRGSGLRGLVDRVEALDGRLEVASAAGSGTRVRAEIPVGS